MPEGPEIRRAADQLAGALINQPLHKVWFERSDLQAYAEQLQHSRIDNIATKGKALLTRFECGLTLYSHNQLYGRWYIVSAGQRPDTRRNLRLEIITPQQSALLYSATDIELLNSAEVDQHPFIARAGIDILSDQPELNTLCEYLAQPRFARRALGGLLLDQGFIAGSGNYLRSEILFAAGLHPATRLVDINGHRRRRLARQIIVMIERAYRTGGVTNDARTVRCLKKQGWKRSRYRHFVFARAGQACHNCATPIQKIQMASRRLYYCPVCQAG